MQIIYEKGDMVQVADDISAEDFAAEYVRLVEYDELTKSWKATDDYGKFNWVKEKYLSP